jgi:hypothetical protein
MRRPDTGRPGVPAMAVMLLLLGIGGFAALIAFVNLCERL